MFIRSIHAVVLALFTTGCFAADIDLGTMSETSPPKASDLKEPKPGDEVPEVGLQASISGESPKDKKRKNIYVLLNPLSNPATRNQWWVQRAVVRRGDQYYCTAQFGEGQQGSGEFFAVIAVATDEDLTIGDRLKGVPEKMIYSKLTIVKRRTR